MKPPSNYYFLVFKQILPNGSLFLNIIILNLLFLIVLN